MIQFIIRLVKQMEAVRSSFAEEGNTGRINSSLNTGHICPR